MRLCLCSLSGAEIGVCFLECGGTLRYGGTRFIRFRFRSLKRLAVIVQQTFGRAVTRDQTGDILGQLRQISFLFL